MYPPYGLPTLIIGATGVGKSLFARLMYDFSRHENIINGDFILFNCADYYNNPQLLISHLFGHIKGAFTGATSDKEGLIEKANGGVLFLDEIHRLPPEGQEMVFYTLDSGNFSRLGETERTRTSRFRFICATTENPESALLKTFIRRLPTIINLPALYARSAQEKFELSCALLKAGSVAYQQTYYHRLRLFKIHHWQHTNWKCRANEIQYPVNLCQCIYASNQ